MPRGLRWRWTPTRQGSRRWCARRRGQAGARRALRAPVAASVPFEEFSFERILAGADLGSAGGRDRALGDLRGVLATVAPGVQRDELVRRAADRLGLSERLVASLAAAGP